MALILNIDTATAHASVCLSSGEELLAIESNPDQKDHAAFIQLAIKKMLAAADCPLSSLDAIAVSNGPGSYTGLRVGLSTAKGLCYALDKPLILINTLEVIATAAINHVTELSSWFCPMIDARRMEVFSAVYDAELKIILPPSPVILNEHSFTELLEHNSIFFLGSGAGKFMEIVKHDNAKFLQVQHDASHMRTIAEKMYLLKSFADKAYSEPYYLKEFFTMPSKLKSD